MLLIPPACAPLRGSVRVPGDKSVTHRALLFAALTPDHCRVTNRLRSEDTDRSLEAIKRLGAVVEETGQELTIRTGAFPARGPAPEGAPIVEIDCGNSGTTARLLMGLLAGRRVRALLDGDDSLRSRPMARVVDPLRTMGAVLRYLGEEGRLPLEVTGAGLTGVRHHLGVASAQVKSALILAGLDARGETGVVGGAGSRDHTERLLQAMGADLGFTAESDLWTVRSGARLSGYDLTVPGDPSSAAFLAAAASLVPGSDLTLTDVLINPSRTGFFREYPGELQIEPGQAPSVDPVGTIRVRASTLEARDYGGAIIPAMIDEVPMLAVLAARACGVTRITEAAELRHKESDRIATTVVGLRSLGVEVQERADGMIIHGCPGGFPTTGTTRIETKGDHRIAMAFAVAGLASRGGVELDDASCAAVSFPGFFELLESLQKTS